MEQVGKQNLKYKQCYAQNEVLEIHQNKIRLAIQTCLVVHNCTYLLSVQSCVWYHLASCRPVQLCCTKGQLRPLQTTLCAKTCSNRSKDKELTQRRHCSFRNEFSVISYFQDQYILLNFPYLGHLSAEAAPVTMRIPIHRKDMLQAASFLLVFSFRSSV